MIWSFVLGAVGMFAGSIFGFSPMLGWGIGSLLGGLFGDNKKVHGQGLADLKIQCSSYGSPIKYLWGTHRIAGTVIWKTDLVEHEHTTTTRGDVDYVEKYYTASWLLQLCKGEIEGIRRIWFGDQVWLDLRDEAPLDVQEQSGYNETKIQILYGTETQKIPQKILDDTPEAEQYLQPDYRGYACLLFKNVQLESNNIPNITVEVVKKGKTILGGWDDRSSDFDFMLTDFIECPAVVSADDKIWMAGGNYRKADLTTWSSDFVYTGEQKQDGSLYWKLTSSYGIPRGEGELIFYPSYSGKTKDRLILLGGYDAGASQTVYDPVIKRYLRKSSFMNMEITLPIERDNWHKAVVGGCPGFPTFGQVPFPRDSFAAAFHVGEYPFCWGIWVYGGRSTHKSSSLPWANGGGSSLQDLWYYNGSTWMSMVEFYTDSETGKYVSADGGLGYRIWPRMLSFRNKLYCGGGFLDGGVNNYFRDVHELHTSGDYLERGFARFVKTCDDVMKAAGFGDAELSSYNRRRDYWLYDFVDYREKLVAILMDGESGSRFYMFCSENGRDWDLMNRGKFTVSGKATGKFTVAGDQRHYVEAGYQITVAGEIDIYGTKYQTWEDYEVASVSFYDDYTHIALKDEFDDPISEIPELLIGSTLYVHIASGRARVPCEFYIQKAGRFITHRGQIWFIGGIVDAAGADKFNIQTITQSEITNERVPLSDIVQEICCECGLSEGDLDVSELENISCHGFSISDTSSGESAITQLQRFGHFDCAETEGILKFPIRGGDPIRTIAESELATHEDGSEPGDKLTLTFNNENSLPKEVEVTYPDANLDYNNNVKRARRIYGSTSKKTKVMLNVAMTAEEAQKVAWVLLLDAWTGRHPGEFTIPIDHLDLEPCDVVVVEHDGQQYTFRLEKLTTSKPGYITIRATPDDIHLYNQTYLTPENSVVFEPDYSLIKDFTTTPFLLDIPIIAEHDDDHGFYFGAAPAIASEVDEWPGSRIYREERDGEIVLYGEVHQPLFHGTTGSALGDASANVIDLKNELLVTMSIGALEAITQDEMIHAQKNLAKVGDELIQFSEAEDLGDGLYKISKLIRGCFGTEWATGSHSTAEEFILLDRDKLARVPMNHVDVGGAFNYRVAVGKRTPDNFAATIAFTNNAIGKKPYSPAQLDATKQSEGSWLIQWSPRIRGPVGNLVGNHATEGAPYEKYLVEFLVDGSIIHKQNIHVFDLDVNRRRYFNLPVNGFEYTVNSLGNKARQYGQTDIFGGEANSITIKVYHVSPTVGLGYPAEGTFTA